VGSPERPEDSAILPARVANHNAGFDSSLLTEIAVNGRVYPSVANSTAFF